MDFGPPEPIPTPTSISPQVAALCASILAEVAPLIVQCRPEPKSQAGECHANVAEKISRDGGSVQYGWVVWEIPPWEIQAEFHAVWRSAEGSLVDVTPALHGGSRVLFLPDARRAYEGKNISSVHYPYTDTPICRDFVELTSALEEITHPPGEPSGEVAVDIDAMMGVMGRMMSLLQRADCK